MQAIFGAGPFFLTCSYILSVVSLWLITCLRLKKLFLEYQGFQWMSNILWFLFWETQIFHRCFNGPYILIVGRQQEKTPTNKQSKGLGVFNLFCNFIALPSMETADISASDTNETFLQTAECFLPASLEIKLCMILQKFIIFFLWRNDLVVKLLQSAVLPYFDHLVTF